MAKLILIIEDERKLASTLEKKLVKEGFDVKIAWDGQEALDFCTKQKPDFILLDLLLPKLSGMEFLRQIRKTYDKTELPVLIITNLTDNHMIKESSVLGAMDYLIKSNIKLVDIVNIVKKYFENKQ